MELHRLQTSIVLFLMLLASCGAVDPEVYFKSVLPNTLMPKAIRDSLPNGSTSYVVGNPKEHTRGYLWRNPASHEDILDTKLAALFLVEKDIHVGKSINLHISRSKTTIPPFLPRQVADSMPIASNKLQDIYKAFKVKPGSVEANLIKTTVNECEEASNQGHDKYCTTSLESMVDSTISKLGKRVKAISTQVDGKETTPLQEYKVEGVKKIATNSSIVVCHDRYYGYAVHYCHKSSKINAYMMSLEGENNVKSKAISICHEDTTSWNPKNIAFQVLNIKPGVDSVCHILIEHEIVWFPY